MSEKPNNKRAPIPFNQEMVEKLMEPMEAIVGELATLQRTVLTLDKAMRTMYEVPMESHKRLNRLEKEFLALEKKLNEKNNPR